MSSSKSSFEVIYLTGVPASGKSTLVKELKKTIAPLFVFEYGEELTKYLKKHHHKDIRHKQIRELSSSVVTPADIKAIDDYLLKQVAAKRGKMHVFIDTHAVTKEPYGYRVTPFRLDQITDLAPTLIVCLYADALTIRSRIQNDAQGRQQITDFEANFHTHLQSAVAVTYGAHLGVPTYFLDSAKPCKLLVKWILSKLSSI